MLRSGKADNILNNTDIHKTIAQHKENLERCFFKFNYNAKIKALRLDLLNINPEADMATQLNGINSIIEKAHICFNEMLNGQMKKFNPPIILPGGDINVAPHKITEPGNDVQIAAIADYLQVNNIKNFDERKNFLNFIYSLQTKKSLQELLERTTKNKNHWM